MFYILLYLLAIISANWSVAHFGASSTIVNAFLFIALDLTVRDSLHERWRGQGLWIKMAALVSVGSILSYLLNAGAGRIALASLIAFGASGITDSLVYALLGNQSKWVRMNGSNIFSAAVDSFIFPAIAFGFPLLWGVVIGQFAAKLFGGFFWSFILTSPLFHNRGIYVANQQSGL